MEAVESLGLSFVTSRKRCANHCSTMPSCPLVVRTSRGGLGCATPRHRRRRQRPSTSRRPLSPLDRACYRGIDIIDGDSRTLLGDGRHKPDSSPFNRRSAGWRSGRVRHALWSNDTALRSQCTLTQINNISNRFLAAAPCVDAGCPS
jgi:hypothetical protein